MNRNLNYSAGYGPIAPFCLGKKEKLPYIIFRSNISYNKFVGFKKNFCFELDQGIG